MSEDEVCPKCGKPLTVAHAAAEEGYIRYFACENPDCRIAWPTGRLADVDDDEETLQNNVRALQSYKPYAEKFADEFVSALPERDRRIRDAGPKPPSLTPTSSPADRNRWEEWREKRGLRRGLPKLDPPSPKQEPLESSSSVIQKMAEERGQGFKP